MRSSDVDAAEHPISCRRQTPPHCGHMSFNILTQSNFFFFLKHRAPPKIYPFPLPAPFPIKELTPAGAGSAPRARDPGVAPAPQRAPADPAPAHPPPRGDPGAADTPTVVDTAVAAPPP